MAKSKHASRPNEIKLKTPTSTSTPLSKPKKRKSASPVMVVAKRQKNEVKSPNKTMVSKQKSAVESPEKKKMQSKDDTGTGTRRSRPGIKALKEIRYYQKTDHLLIPKLSFCRLVKEILLGMSAYDLRIQTHALSALQESTEAFGIRYLQDANACAIHAKRITIQPKDMKLVAYFQKP